MIERLHIVIVYLVVCALCTRLYIVYQRIQDRDYWKQRAISLETAFLNCVHGKQAMRMTFGDPAAEDWIEFRCAMLRDSIYFNPKGTTSWLKKLK